MNHISGRHLISLSCTSWRGILCSIVSIVSCDCVHSQQNEVHGKVTIALTLQMRNITNYCPLTWANHQSTRRQENAMKIHLLQTIFWNTYVGANFQPTQIYVNNIKKRLDHLPSYHISKKIRKVKFIAKRYYSQRNEVNGKAHNSVRVTSE